MAKNIVLNGVEYAPVKGTKPPTQKVEKKTKADGKRKPPTKPTKTPPKQTKKVGGKK